MMSSDMSFEPTTRLGAAAAVCVVLSATLASGCSRPPLELWDGHYVGSLSCEGTFDGVPQRAVTGAHVIEIFHCETEGWALAYWDGPEEWVEPACPSLRCDFHLEDADERGATAGYPHCSQRDRSFEALELELESLSRTPGRIELDYRVTGTRRTDSSASPVPFEASYHFVGIAGTAPSPVDAGLPDGGGVPGP